MTGLSATRSARIPENKTEHSWKGDVCDPGNALWASGAASALDKEKRTYGVSRHCDAIR